MPPSKYGPIMLKMASFTLSVVGLVFMPGTAFSVRPLASPAMALTAIAPFYLIPAYRTIEPLSQ
ncbi:hypothetical protein D3C72_2496120 [compost metagenome]